MVHNPHQSPQLKYVEIDDSGLGASSDPRLYIGIHREDIGAIRIIKIPEDYFTTEFKYKYGLYQYRIVDEVAAVFNELNINTEDFIIRVCKAVHFVVLKRWLTEHGFEYENAKIEGYLQGKLRAYLRDNS